MLIGSLVGGPAGAAIGYLIGSAIGSAFQKQNDATPLENLKLSRSEYGSTIPIPYGTKRYDAQVIWQTDLKPHPQRHGKGGGGPITSYTYTASFALMFTDQSSGPAVAIPKIFFDGITVYDESSDFAALPMKIYLGTADQDVDPTMEAVLGVGNVPAYRRYCYVVFTDFDVTNYGNSLPRASAAVATKAGTFPWRYSTFNVNNTGFGLLHPSATINKGIISVGWGFRPSYSPVIYNGAYELDGTVTTAIYEISATAIGSIQVQSALIWSDGSSWENNDGTVVAITANPTGGILANSVVRATYQDGYLYALSVSLSADFYITRWPAPNGRADGTLGSGLSDLQSGVVQSGGFVSLTLLGTTNNHMVYLNNTNSSYVVQEYDPNTLAFVREWDYSALHAVVPMINGRPFAVYHNRAGKLVLVADRGISGSKTVYCWYLNDDLTVTPIGGVGYGQAYGPVDPYTLLVGAPYMLVGDGVIALEPPVAPVTLKEINDDIDSRCSVAHDNSALEPILVKGYSIDRQSIGRDCLAPLQSIYQYDKVERAGTMVSVLRGGPSMISIPQSDLATHPSEDDSDTNAANLPPLVEIKETASFELPVEVTISHIDPDLDWEVNTQRARRQNVTTELKMSAQVPIVLSADEALAAANTVLYNAWTERDGLTIKVPRKYWVYEPTDVVTVTDAEGTAWLMVFRNKNDSVPGVITFEGVAGNRMNYLQGQSVGDSGDGFTPTTPGPAQDTTLLLLDRPLLTDADSPNGIYGILIPSDDGGYPGGGIFQSLDGGANYTQIAASDIRGIVGTTSDALGDFGGGNVFDEGNSVTIAFALPGDALRIASADETAVLAGANLALIGNELLQYKNVDNPSAGVAVLSGLLRGRRGTEWAINTHSAGEQCVFFPPSTNPPALFSELGNSYKYKGVTVGGALADATAQDFTNYGMALMPYAPVQVGGAPITPFDGTVQINWIRRTRVGGAWNNYNDVPLSEPSEAYVVQIWDAAYALVARIITTTTPTCTYSAADQVTDFGATQQNIYITVGQVGSYTLGTQTRAVIAGLGASDDAPLNPVPPYNGAPTPPSGSGVVGATLVYPISITHTSGVVIGDTFIAKFTTTTAPTGGYVSVAEFTGPPYTRHLRLCTDLAGTALVTNGEIWGNPASLLFGSGAGQCNLSAATAYYLHITMQLPNGAPSGPLGAPADVGITLNAS